MRAWGLGVKVSYKTANRHTQRPYYLINIDTHFSNTREVLLGVFIQSPVGLGVLGVW